MIFSAVCRIAYRDPYIMGTEENTIKTRLLRRIKASGQEAFDVSV